uniref:Uncharacterized protein n=1 Tax=Oryza punctata TaxID=4537 RepID=A0A0E0MKI3_ORYPU
MDPNPLSGFSNLFNDPDLAANLGQSSSQPTFVHRHLMFPYAHPQFPALCTQPPSTPSNGPHRQHLNGLMIGPAPLGQIPNPKCQILNPKRLKIGGAYSATHTMRT